MQNASMTLPIESVQIHCSSSRNVVVQISLSLLLGIVMHDGECETKENSG